jgi:hypothetical protein
MVPETPACWNDRPAERSFGNAEFSWRVYSSSAKGDGTFLAALRISALFGRFELQGELAPMSFVP